MRKLTCFHNHYIEAPIQLVFRIVPLQPYLGGCRDYLLDMSGSGPGDCVSWIAGRRAESYVEKKR